MNTFQDQEYEEETGWVKFKWRNHQPDIGRFFNVDPLAEDYVYNSPYAFAENRVVNGIELEGLEHYNAGSTLMVRRELEIAGASEEELAAYDEGVAEVGKNMVRYGTPAEDIYGLFSGKDFDGNSYNRAEAGMWGALTFVPGVKLGKVFKSLRFSDDVKGIVKSSGHMVDESGKVGKEIITTLKEGSETSGDAFKVAKDIVGDLGEDAVEHIGRKGIGKDALVGFKSADGKKGYRVDYDKGKGAHVNWWNGKEKGAVLFKSSEGQVKQIISNEVVKGLK